jgi:hypothetical protein
MWLYFVSLTSRINYIKHKIALLSKLFLFTAKLISESKKLPTKTLGTIKPKKKSTLTCTGL